MNQNYLQNEATAQAEEEANYSKYIDNLNKKYNYLDKYGETLDTYSNKFGVSKKAIKRALDVEMTSLDKSDGKWKDYRGRSIKSQKELNSIIESGIRQNQRFNMNALGVMFAGMALNRTMTNLVSTSIS